MEHGVTVGMCGCCENIQWKKEDRRCMKGARELYFIPSYACM